VRSIATLVASVLYLFAPLIVASMFAGIVMRFDLLPSLRRPIDAGRTFHGRRLLGDHKTWRGVVIAVIGCSVAVAVQKYALSTHAGAIALVEYRGVNVALFGAAMGAGAMLGELPNSFVKRQLGIESGKTGRGLARGLFYLWDQVDVLSSWAFVSFWVRPTFRLVATSFALALAIHPLVALIGYAVGARKSAR
jgi:CDP-2,3-bis-(O-geranylgeranyl)-sn-glycerol synthase